MIAGSTLLLSFILRNPDKPYSDKCVFKNHSTLFLRLDARTNVLANGNLSFIFLYNRDTFKKAMAASATSVPNAFHCVFMFPPREIFPVDYFLNFKLLQACPEPAQEF